MVSQIQILVDIWPSLGNNDDGDNGGDDDDGDDDGDDLLPY